MTTKTSGGIREPIEVPASFATTAAAHALSNPETVQRILAELLTGYEQDLFGFTNKTLAKPEFVSRTRARITEYATIIRGKHPDYVGTVGYHDLTLPAKLRADLGPYWREHRSEWDDDPIAVMLQWLVMMLTSARKQAKGDAMLTDVLFKPSLKYANAVILGIEQRVTSDADPEPEPMRKAHNPGYTRKDGTYVAPFDDTRTGATPKLVLTAPPSKPAASTKQWAPMAATTATGSGKAPHQTIVAPQLGINAPPQKPARPPDAWHPRTKDDGGRVPIHYAHQPSENLSWYLPWTTATFVPDGPVPEALHGVALTPWTPPEDWSQVKGQARWINEPPFDPAGLEPAAGVVVVEKDSRVWLVCPTNRHAGYKATYPKGHADDGLSLQVTAIKEAFEESGLHVAINDVLGDFSSGITKTRYYVARRIGGTPAAMGWESQAVKLVPRDKLKLEVHTERDLAIADALLAWLDSDPEDDD